jgi:hypothetical protein
MQRSSETIGAIAAALAKAQAELTNPEKALVATIRTSNPREQDQTFRYAALSSGLDIVRKALGSHDIATVQATAIDREAGLIRLTTTLAHSSGEWLSSEWPVCPIGETAAPRRMGAALTYARRYALFTLVGIAGEDDLDAPDLDARPVVGKINGRAGEGNSVARALEAGSSATAGATDAGSAPRSKEGGAHHSRSVLTPGHSAALRERLIAELALLQSEDEAADWVHKNLPAKNTMEPGDADIIEASFRDKLIAIERASAINEATSAPGLLQFGGALTPDPSGASNGPCLVATDAPALVPTAPVKTRRRSRHVAAKAIRLRDKEHCKFVAIQPCVVCGRAPSEAHHIRFAQPRALGRKVSDEYTVPVCRLHHRELHKYGDEASWWAGVGMDPLPIALELWQRSRAVGPFSRLLDERDQ